MKIKTATHTPGPWKISNVPGRDALAVDANDDHNEHVATVWYSEHPAAEGAANARLIAAAPELLKVLKALSETSQWVVSEETPSDAQWKAFNASITAAFTAIHKVEGK